MSYIPNDFTSETAFALWEAEVADHTPEGDGQDYWRRFRLERRNKITDAELYEVLRTDQDAESRRRAADELDRRRALIERARR